MDLPIEVGHLYGVGKGKQLVVVQEILGHKVRVKDVSNGIEKTILVNKLKPAARVKRSKDGGI